MLSAKQYYCIVIIPLTRDLEENERCGSGHIFSSLIISLRLSLRDKTSSQSTTLNTRGIKSFIFPIIEHFVSGVCTSCTGLKWAPHAQGIRRNVRIAEHTGNKSHMWISQLFLSCVADEAAHFQETHVHVSFWSDKQTSPGHCGITLC